MAFNVNKFRSSFDGAGIGSPASPNSYEVRIVNTDFVTKIQEDNDPFKVTGRPPVTFELLTYRCISCDLPSRSLITSDRSTYGPSRKIVAGSQFHEVNFSFIASSEMSEKYFFYLWQRSILNSDMSGTKDQYTYVNDIRYYHDYTSAIEILQYNKVGDQVYTVTLHEAYPISVREVPLGWDMTNDFIKVNVTMAYRFFTEDNFVTKHTQPEPQPEIKKFKPKPKYNFPYLKGIL